MTRSSWSIPMVREFAPVALGCGRGILFILSALFRFAQEFQDGQGRLLARTVVGQLVPLPDDRTFQRVPHGCLDRAAAGGHLVKPRLTHAVSFSAARSEDREST